MIPSGGVGAAEAQPRPQGGNAPVDLSGAEPGAPSAGEPSSTLSVGFDVVGSPSGPSVRQIAAGVALLVTVGIVAVVLTWSGAQRLDRVAELHARAQHAHGERLLDTVELIAVLQEAGAADPGLEAAWLQLHLAPPEQRTAALSHYSLLLSEGVSALGEPPEGWEALAASQQAWREAQEIWAGLAGSESGAMAIRLGLAPGP